MYTDTQVPDVDDTGGEKARSKPRVGELSIPGKNGGTLRNGGTNKGGTGRPPSEVKAAWMEALQTKGTARLEKCIESEDDSIALRAIEITARHTLATKTVLTSEDVPKAFADVMAIFELTDEEVRHITNTNRFNLNMVNRVTTRLCEALGVS